VPEGPEIRREADRIARALAGRKATRVEFAFPALRRHASRLAGRRVRAVEPRGKALLIHFAGGLSIYSHNQLYGRWFVTPAGRLPSTRRSLRLAIHNRERSALLYSASEIEVLRPTGIERHPYLSKLGPDALDPRLRDAALVRRLDDPRFARRSLAALLLDQAFVAGIGNYLRAEILFTAGVHPARRPQDLSPAERKALARAIRAVSRQSYRTGGITNELARARRLAAQGLRRGEYRHHVFARAGQRCWTCGTTIRRADLGGRRIFFCPRCQPKPST
jgi:endonuclease-8